MKNFKDLAISLNGGEGIPFMEGRTKGELLPMGSPVTIADYGFIDGTDGEYVVLALREFPTMFFFGGLVVTEKMSKLDAQLNTTEKAAMMAEGLPVLFTKKQNKAKKREYVAVEFYPEEV